MTLPSFPGSTPVALPRSSMGNPSGLLLSTSATLQDSATSKQTLSMVWYNASIELAYAYDNLVSPPSALSTSTTLSAKL